MAFTNLRVQNFTLADSLGFTNNISLSRSQDNFALCQVYVRSSKVTFLNCTVLQCPFELHSFSYNGKCLSIA